MAYQYAEMSRAQIADFLQAPRFAIVGTNRLNGARSSLQYGISTKTDASI